MKINSHNEFVKVANKIHDNKYKYPEKYINTTTKIKIICPIHDEFFKLKYTHINKKEGCPMCTFSNNSLTLFEFIEKSKKVHNNKYDYSLVEYKNTHTKVKIICPEHGIFEQLSGNHLYLKNGCPQCNGGVRSNKESFIKKSKEIHDNKYDYSLVKYTKAIDNVKIICLKHGEFKQSPHAHLKGEKCPKCSKVYRRNYFEFIEDANKRHKNKYIYPEQKFINVKTKIQIICKEHGEFKQSPDSHLRGSGCPICKESKGELKIRQLFEEKKIKYITQKRFKDCKYKNPLPFDFYLPEYNLCIEFDGQHHFESIKIWDGENGLKKQKIKDEIKNKYCILNNIQLLRIKYNDNIEKIINNI